MRCRSGPSICCRRWAEPEPRFGAQGFGPGRRIGGAHVVPGREPHAVWWGCLGWRGRRLCGRMSQMADGNTGSRLLWASGRAVRHGEPAAHVRTGRELAGVDRPRQAHGLERALRLHRLCGVGQHLQRFEVDHVQRAPAVALVRSSTVVDVQLGDQALPRRTGAVVDLEAHLDVPHAEPQPLHERLVPSTALAGHGPANADARILGHELRPVRLGALVGVGDLWAAPARRRFARGAHESARLRRARHALGQHPAAGQARHRHQVHPAARHRDVGDAKRSERVVPRECQPAQRVREPRCARCRPLVVGLRLSDGMPELRISVATCRRPSSTPCNRRRSSLGASGPALLGAPSEVVFARIN